MARSGDTSSSYLCVWGWRERERNVLVPLFSCIDNISSFFFFFVNSFGAKEVAEIVSLLILILILIAKLRECIITLRGPRMVDDGAGAGTSTGTSGDGDTGGNRTDVEHKISVDNSIPASVGASMTAENGVDV